MITYILSNAQSPVKDSFDCCFQIQIHIHPNNTRYWIQKEYVFNTTCSQANSRTIGLSDKAVIDTRPIGLLHTTISE